MKNSKLNIAKFVIFRTINLMILALTITYINSNTLFAKSTFSSERIISSIESLIASRTSGSAVIEFVSNPKTCEFDEDNIDAEIILPDIISPGYNIIAIKFFQNNRIVKYLEINTRIRLIQDVWVANRNIPSNTILSENDIIQKKKLINNSSEIADINYIVGKKLTRSIIKDDIIEKDHLVGELLIKRNEKVMMIVEAGGIRIRCTGTAVQDGSEGQLIRVKRDGTSSVLTGKVAPTGDVIIYSNNLSRN